MLVAPIDALLLGKVRVDPEVFPADDDISYGWVIETYDWTTDERWEEYPEGFIWSCCEERQDEGNCIVRRHMAAWEHPEDCPGISSENEVEGGGSRDVARPTKRGPYYDLDVKSSDDSLNGGLPDPRD